MKKMYWFVLILAMITSMAGCSSADPKTINSQEQAPAVAEQKDTAVTGAEAVSDEKSNEQEASDNQAVPLADNFPKEILLPEGVVLECAELKPNFFRVYIDTKFSSVEEVHAYYKSKLTKVINEGYINSDVKSPMAEIEGMDGDWKLNVMAVQYNKKGPVVVTLLVKHKDA